MLVLSVLEQPQKFVQSDLQNCSAFSRTGNYSLLGV